MTKGVILDWANKSCGSLEWPDFLSEDGVRCDVMHRVVRWQDAASHTGSRSVKTRSMVKATGKKPFRQKGTGRARQGTTVAPHMRGGGVCFGPSPEEVRSFSLPKRIRRMGLRSALTHILENDGLFALKAEDFSSAKTKDFVACVEKNSWESALFISLEKSFANLERACANLKGYDVLPVAGLNVRDILRHKNVFIFQDAVDAVMHKVRA